MRTVTGRPANDPRPPEAARRRRAAGPGVEARLERLLADRRMQHLLRHDGPTREVVLRLAQVVRRELAESRSDR